MEKIKIIDAIKVKKLAQESGFDLCGITRAEHLESEEQRFCTWLETGSAGDLDYMRRYLELRFDASRLVEGARTVIVCGVNYKNEFSLGESGLAAPKIASYALSRDYHKTIRKRLKRLLAALQELEPSLAGRVFVDSAPLLEKAHAVKAGLGWVGRQSLLVTPEFGTFILLGELVIDALVDEYDAPFKDEKCGSCRSCIEVCPAQAINENRTIDASRCISARTVESDKEDDLPLAAWIFGCDECQSCCPHNCSTPLFQNEDMRPILRPLLWEEWDKLNEERFKKYAEGTALKRSNLQRINRLLKSRNL